MATAAGFDACRVFVPGFHRLLESHSICIAYVQSSCALLQRCFAHTKCRRRFAQLHSGIRLKRVLHQGGRAVKDEHSSVGHMAAISCAIAATFWPARFRLHSNMPRDLAIPGRPEVPRRIAVRDGVLRRRSTFERSIGEGFAVGNKSG
jgi:hypothetical protein